MTVPKCQEYIDKRFDEIQAKMATKDCITELHETIVEQNSKIDALEAKIETVEQCLEKVKAWFKRRTSHAPNLTCELSTSEAGRLNQFGLADSIWRGNQLWIGRSCGAARLKHSFLSNVQLFMCQTLCIICFLSHNSLLCQ